MRIGVYCGSFSPVHKGHINIVKKCLKQKLVDKVIIIATGSYWHKEELIDLNDRLNMLDFFACDNIVIDRKHNEIPYTYEIFRKLKIEYPKDELFFIVGADNLPRLNEWNHYEELLTYNFIVVRRGKIGPKQIDEYMILFNKSNYTILETKGNNASSTYIRNNLNDYRKIQKMIHKNVYNYLIKINRP